MGGPRGGPDPPEKSQTYRVSKQCLSNHIATKPAFIDKWAGA